RHTGAQLHSSCRYVVSPGPIHTEAATHDNLCVAECLRPLRAAWRGRRIEDRRVTLLVFLPRCGLPVVLRNRFREFFAFRPRMRAVVASMVPGATASAGLRSSAST